MSAAPTERGSALITGASGFIGIHLCRLLAQRRWRLIAASRRAGSHGTPKGTVVQPLTLLSEPEKWQMALRSIDCVVHLAALVHQMRPTAGVDARLIEVNVEGSRFAVEQAIRAGVRRFVFISSAKVHGEGGTDIAYRAQDTPEPRDAYGRSKLAAEVAIREACTRSGTEFAIIRPPLVYGPGVRANFERLLRLSASSLPLPLASIKNARSLVGVENLADFIALCMTHPLAAGRAWLVSDTKDLSTPELIRKLARFMNRPARLFSFPPDLLKATAKALGRGDEAAKLCDSFRIDSSPARDDLDWRAPLAADEGLERTVAAFRERSRS